MNPSISVVVPTRDRPELLRRALASIVGQRYNGDLEVIVVFDQGTPSDVDVPVADARRIRTIANDRIAGLAGARNCGVLAATGDLVAYCDDDDESHPDNIRRQVEALADEPLAEVVVTGTTIVYGSRMVHRIPPNHHVTFDELLRSRVQEVHPSSIVVKRSAMMDGIGLVDEEIPGSYGEDYDWLLRAARRAPIVVVRSPLTRAYWHQASFFADRWTSIIEAIHYLLAKFPEFHREPLGLALLYGRLAFAHAALGHRSEARMWARRTLRLNPRERRAYLAFAVSMRVVSAPTLMRLAHRRGRGI
jgi:glycosyltransferase involved in cell wall biosynthesis